MKIKETKIELPEIGIEVLGFNQSWIDEDYNINGVCVCYYTGDCWFIAKWCGNCDCWHTKCSDQSMNGDYKEIEAPTHWIMKPEFNL